VTASAHLEGVSVGRCVDSTPASGPAAEGGNQHSMGERDRRTIVWDYIAVYPIGAISEGHPPKPLYNGSPVVSVRTTSPRFRSGDVPCRPGYLLITA
jgi:hypothetical protein